MRLPVYVLRPDCDRDLVLRSDLDYFRSAFVGRPMADGWHPPKIRIQGKTKQVRDFVSWMLSAPVISEKAKLILEPLISPFAEILPLIVLRRHQYYAINVTHLVDCLNHKESDIVYSPTDGRVMNIWRYSLHNDRVGDAAIFKLSEHPGGEVFVTTPFVKAVKDAGLAGAAFADPTVSPFRAILRGESENVT